MALAAAAQRILELEDALEDTQLAVREVGQLSAKAKAAEERADELEAALEEAHAENKRLERSARERAKEAEEYWQEQ